MGCGVGNEAIGAPVLALRASTQLSLYFQAWTLPAVPSARPQNRTGNRTARQCPTTPAGSGQAAGHGLQATGAGLGGQELPADGTGYRKAWQESGAAYRPAQPGPGSYVALLSQAAVLECRQADPAGL